MGDLFGGLSVFETCEQEILDLSWLIQGRGSGIRLLEFQLLWLASMKLKTEGTFYLKAAKAALPSV